MQKVILFFLITVTVVSCKSGNGSTAQKTEESRMPNIETAFLQKEIPGTQGEKEKTYLTLRFSDQINEEVKLEKVWFVGESYAIEETNLRDEKTLKIDVTKSNFWNKSTIPEVKLYHKIAKKVFVENIRIEIKEPIYLP